MINASANEINEAFAKTNQPEPESEAFAKTTQPEPENEAFAKTNQPEQINEAFAKTNQPDPEYEAFFKTNQRPHGKPDDETYSALINTPTKSNREMQQQKCMRDDVTYSPLINASAKAIEQIMEQMLKGALRDSGRPPEAPSWEERGVPPFPILGGTAMTKEAIA